MALDWWGVNLGLFACTGIIFIGSVISAAATNIDNWRMMAGGKVSHSALSASDQILIDLRDRSFKVLETPSLTLHRYDERAHRR